MGGLAGAGNYRLRRSIHNLPVHRETIDFNRRAAHLKRPMTCLYGTSVAIGGAGILLQGPSGSGKTDLALRLIDEGACLVADDQTEVQRSGNDLSMRAPAALAGLIEARGLGIMRVPHIADAPLRLIVELAAESAIERMPEARIRTIDGVAIPVIALDPHAASAPAKLRLAMKALKTPPLAGALALP
jgi:HPr kinase/phosphorylase